MKKNILLMFLAILSQSSFALFSPNLPQQIICDEHSFCSAQNPKYDVSGWSFVSDYDVIKPGIYTFQSVNMYGNPNDNFKKRVEFYYTMKDKDGFDYRVSYIAINWLVPVYRENYKAAIMGGYCTSSSSVKDCYVMLLTPQSK